MVMEAAQASVGLLNWWVLDKKPGHVVVFAMCRLSSSDLDSAMYGGAV
ncbi:hypothetical protein Patl1_12469 [Pistacia atlantica]|uniref:Uncharacterized protein n=1 Tax=Pistacia atlantica TaxID=434234 RepID=A0ACC1AWL8_9ROSI|nr:hypothetical protein Patl1_12469 [Pistacia atlantica]